MTALRERERELAELGGAIEEARSGRGRIVVIEAHAGLGKTRLVQAAREAGARAGLHVLTARGTELERDFPFALVRQLFEPRLASLAAPERDTLFEGASCAARGALGMADGAPAADAFAALHGLYWLTAALAERHPLLLAVDDAHWSDAASLDYLRFLLPRLEELPLLLVVACRPSEPGAAPGLARIATDGAARRLTPGALSRDAAAALLAEELGAEPRAEVAATCHEVSGGNPFYLCELARTIDPAANDAVAVRELAPERVTRTVLLRVARLSPAARAVALALAVLGDDADARIVAELAGLDADAVTSGADELRGAAILDPGPTPCFIHPLVRTALHSDLPAGERSTAHARAAELLREHGAEPEQLAAHLAASEPRGERATVETLLAAARRALAGGAPQPAIAQLTRALKEPPPPDLRTAVLETLITASLRAADPSVFAAIEADVFAELERDPALLSRWAPELTPWLALSGRFDEALALLERAIEVAAGEDDVDWALRLEVQLSSVAQLPPATARARLARYRDRVPPDGPGERLAAALEAVWCLSDGSATEAVELARRALRDGTIFAEQTDLVTPGEAVVALAVAGQLDEAAHAADQALAIAQRRGAATELAGAWYQRGCVAIERGDLAAAEADARQAAGIADLCGILTALAPLTALLVDVLVERGELDAAEARLNGAGIDGGAVPDLIWFGPLLFARARLRLAQGHPRQAVDDLDELRRRMERWGTGGSAIMQAGSHAARALVALGEHERAHELAAAQLVHARRWGAPASIAQALRALGLATPGPAGVELLHEAVAMLDDSPARLERAHALSDLGTVLRRTNRRAEARAPLREALELARRCGAAGLAKHVHDELLASGEKVRRYTPLGVESLTPSERRVAEMAASGLTNRQIAQSLFLTVKTIETHLGAAYDKLGIRSRRQLAGALEDQ